MKKPDPNSPQYDVELDGQLLGLLFKRDIDPRVASGEFPDTIRMRPNPESVSKLPDKNVRRMYQHPRNLKWVVYRENESLEIRMGVVMSLLLLGLAIGLFVVIGPELGQSGHSYDPALSDSRSYRVTTSVAGKVVGESVSSSIDSRVVKGFKDDVTLVFAGVVMCLFFVGGIVGTVGMGVRIRRRSRRRALVR